MNIEPRPKRERVHAVVAPETLRWLTEKKTEYQVSYGVLIDNLVKHQKLGGSDARS